MTKAEVQARWRARSPKKAIELRLSPEALNRLDNMARRMNAPGRAAVVEALLMADAGGHADVLLNESLRLSRSVLLATGQAEAALRDRDGRLIVVSIEPADGASRRNNP